ncbi:daunorubicin resistance protein DrrA family ABC transporter ATP-binding protein [Ruminiclostridium cellobioparum]|uniref:Daunorubicin resistance ABC transporter ATP-binding subunit n=1 Tax=Ruminiclostridium cellobioparum subsp. termitidis CT1112 TaxID=1195236 RepID=S0FFR4_RUMCE|nr:daunorubicin resistance protein DrrA family ABC transporter ATP-binding protein [Ruminiclostridium cellobioparum]EMS69497.1 daunorubicin resistance ABC transporter ATP-binding subunit [Ruminiclostridium cellobioparum subsp. termitidis CT1112]
MFKADIAISVKGLEKSYKKLKVLKGINLTIKKGSIFALLGANGAGKTTTVKILTTLLKPDKGSVQICGLDILSQADKVRGAISLTGQYAAVDEVMTGKENLRMIGKLRHLSDVNSRADELLSRFELTDAADRRVAAYSGGMRRRLDLAMSLLGDPSVIFLDEPTTGLDPQSRIAMWKIIKELSRSGITVFLTTQYLDEADQLADQIAILNDGKIVAEGTAAELKKLLPHGHIELKFNDGKLLQAVRDLLKEYSSSQDIQNSTLSVVTDGSIKQITDILNKLEKQGIPVAEFSQKLPTLEEVFLAIIGENKEKEAI